MNIYTDLTCPMAGGLNMGSESLSLSRMASRRLSNVSSTLRHPTHLHIDVHAIFA